MHNFQAMMLKGAEMETLESRREFGFDTRFRVLPKNFGVYGDEKVFDVEEIVVATDTLPFDDYVTARKYHLASSVFWNDSWFDVVVRFAKNLGIRSSEWWEAMLPGMTRGPAPVRQFLDDFVGETKNELFPSRETCIEFYSREENFRRLQNGEIGDNLMYKYRAKASFHVWKPVCQVAMDATRELLEACGISGQVPQFSEFWSDFAQFDECRHASGFTVEEITRPVRCILRYDLDRWVQDGCPASPAAYRLDRPSWFEFRLSEESARELAAALQVWGTELKGLSKLITRIKVSWQVRECRILEPENSLAAVG
ncbi:MAG: hypothetical protein ACRD88_18990, partial [Terriglobia bacterium]